MKAVVRGAAVAAVLALALTACEDGSTTAGGAPTNRATADSPAQGGQGGGGSSAPTDQQSITPNFPPVSINATDMYAALPADGSLETMSSGETIVVQDADALRGCAELTRSPCAAGIQVAGHKDMESRDPDGARVEFSLLAFADAAGAATEMKALAEQKRKPGEADEHPVKPLKMDTGAEETEAFQHDNSIDVVMRVGSVVAYVMASDTSPDNVKYAAKLQIARVQAVAAGIDPDRG
ncbi:hypothetical protein [Streptomyces sp. NRRL B-24572]|uniref:hypothetical protein n=1 Tax=Streptomyces sp. NRRL B-24572 TaxID=1962156 RepID=UPI000A391752|nr:hypothetical protein [Streptomyces sp. NRRL B-24572]